VKQHKTIEIHGAKIIMKHFMVFYDLSYIKGDHFCVGKLTASKHSLLGCTRAIVRRVPKLLLNEVLLDFYPQL